MQVAAGDAAVGEAARPVPLARGRLISNIPTFNVGGRQGRGCG